jgi:hypothetical protein
MRAGSHYRYGSPAAHDLAAVGDGGGKCRSLGDSGSHRIPRDVALIHKDQATASLKMRRSFRSTVRGPALELGLERALGLVRALRRAPEQPPFRSSLWSLRRHRLPGQGRRRQEP